MMGDHEIVESVILRSITLSNKYAQEVVFLSMKILFLPFYWVIKF